MTMEAAIAIISVVGSGLALAGQWAVQRVKIQDMQESIKELRLVIDSHLQRTDIHVDPVRDEARWSALTRTLERIERRLDRIYHHDDKDITTVD